MQRFYLTNCLPFMHDPRRQLLAAILCLGSLCASGQGSASTDTYLQPALSTYRKAIGENIPYNEGREFPGYGIKLDGHPFFQTEQLSEGDIVYDGTLYTGVPMLYDLVSDEVLVRPPGYQYLVRLSREKVPAFSYMGQQFFRADPDSSGQRYYQSLYDGSVRVIAQKRKQLNHVTTNERAIDRFDQYDSYYIVTRGELVRVSGKGSVMNVFRDRRDQVRAVIARENLSFRKDPETFLRRCAAAYDQKLNP